MPTVCKEDKHDHYEFQHTDKRKVTANFEGGQITSDGGAVILREVAKKTGILRDASDCFTDGRDQARITHTLDQLIHQRVLGLACGYEDVVDHDELRRDPMWGLLAGKANPDEEPAAGKSTLNRLEMAAAKQEEPSRYHKIDVDQTAFENSFTRWYIRSHRRNPPARIVLDIDATDTPLHGDQENKFYHGYYGHYCYLPLYIFAGQQLLWAELRPADVDPAKGAVGAISRIVEALREAWPTVDIIVRGDSGFAREDLMSWCEASGVDYVLGLAKNNRLKQALAPQLASAKRLSGLSGRKERVFGEFRYRTLDSWSRSRRVIGKAEWGPRGPNSRFVVTSLHPADRLATECYEQLYCARGEAENRIKEQQLDLFADRASCKLMAANQLRLWLSSVAYWLITELRRLGLAGTQWASAQGRSIRNKLLKIGGLIRVSVRRVWLVLSSGYAWKDTFGKVTGNICRARSPGVG